MSRITTFFLCSAIVFLGTLLGFDAKAQDKPWTYWYKGNWGYQSLKEAENAMHSDGSDPKFQYMQYRNSYADPDGLLIMNYSAPDRSATVGPVLYSHGLGTDDKPCGSDWCSDEDTIVKFLKKELTAQDNDDCTTGSFSLTGSYTEPFEDMVPGPAPRTEGFFSFSKDRALLYTRKCKSGMILNSSVALFK